MDIMGRWFIGLLSVSQGKAGQPPVGYYISSAAGQPWAYQVRPETVGQFTGLLDKNGKEIYEKEEVIGAHFNGSYKEGIVEWSNALASFVILPMDGEYCHVDLCQQASSLLVINDMYVP